MHKKILVPTDFSQNAYLAAEFACNLALEKKLQIHLYHYYTFASSNFEGEIQNTEVNETQVLKADIKILEVKNKLAALYPSLLIETTCERGLLQEKLPAVAKQEDYSFIVMGTTGSSEEKSIIYGSNTVAITSKSPIPVIAIPFQANDFQITRVGLLTNFKAEEIETLVEYIDLVREIDQLYLIHVYREGKTLTEIKDQLESWAYNIRELSGINQVFTYCDQISKDDVALDSVSEVVNRFVDKNEIDFLLVTKTRKSFFNRIFTPSVSKEIALDLKVPAFFDKIL